MILGPHTLIVQTTDMDRSVAFFRDVLKLTPGYTSPYWSDFALGSIRLGIHPVFEGNNAPHVIPFKNAIIGVETNNLAELKSALENSGGYVRSDYHQTPGGVILDFVDPEGNNFQAIQVGSKLKDFS
jgi:predicted enzyme related to lactoylglutathione lyase